MKHSVHLGLACALLLTLWSQSGCGKASDSTAKPPAKPLEEQVTAIIQPLIDDGWMQGAVAGITRQGEDRFFAFGDLGDPAKTKPDAHSVFEIGSITQVFTSILLAALSQEEGIELDDPISKHAPSEWKIPDPGGSPITLADLASHTSGLPVVPLNFWEQGDNTFDVNTAGRRWQAYQAEDIQSYFDQPFPPMKEDRQYLYSNLGGGLLGYLLEQQSGQSITQLIKDRVCQPLALAETSFDLASSGPGHDCDGNVVEPWSIGNSVLGSAYALKSTAADLMKLAHATMQPTNSPLQAALEEVSKPRIDINAYEKSALGWKINQYGVIYTSGATGGFRCAMFIHPATKTAVVLLANTQVGGVIGSMAQTFDSVAASLLNASLNTPPLEINYPSVAKVDPQGFQDYVGRYRPETGEQDPSFPVTVDGDKLMTVGPGNTPMRLWPMGKDAFFLRAYTSRLKFLRNSSGTVTGVDLKFEGQEARLLRDKEATGN